MQNYSVLVKLISLVIKWKSADYSSEELSRPSEGTSLLRTRAQDPEMEVRE